MNHVLATRYSRRRATTLLSLASAHQRRSRAAWIAECEAGHVNPATREAYQAWDRLCDQLTNLRRYLDRDIEQAWYALKLAREVLEMHAVGRAWRYVAAQVRTYTSDWAVPAKEA